MSFNDYQKKSFKVASKFSAQLTEVVLREFREWGMSSQVQHASSINEKDLSQVIDFFSSSFIDNNDTSALSVSMKITDEEKKMPFFDADVINHTIYTPLEKFTYQSVEDLQSLKLSDNVVGIDSESNAYMFSIKSIYRNNDKTMKEGLQLKLVEKLPTSTVLELIKNSQNSSSNKPPHVIVSVKHDDKEVESFEYFGGVMEFNEVMSSHIEHFIKKFDADEESDTENFFDDLLTDSIIYVY